MVMQTDKEARKFPACGYGLLGLCCSSCLLGPCRISPFETEFAKGLCGENADMMVVKNLLRLVAGDVAAVLKALGATTKRLGASTLKETSYDEAQNEWLERLAKKHGLDSKVTIGRLNHYLLKESEKLLSLLTEPDRQNSLLVSLFPKAAFPYIRHDTFFSSSLSSTLFDTLNPDQSESLPVERILWQCLKTAVVKYIADDLRQDMQFLINGKNLPKLEKETMQVVENLAPEYIPRIVLLSIEEGVPEEFTSRPVADLQEQLLGHARLVPIKNINSLPSIGRYFFNKHSFAMTEFDPVAVILSKSAASVLGALVCGFSVVSSPALPIHGSELVERYLCEDLKKDLGSVYLPSRTGKILPTILEFLRRKQ